MNYMPPHSHTHCQVTQSHPQKPKLGNKYDFATAEKEKLTKFEMNRKEMIKHESTTMAISNAEKSDKNETNE